MKPRSFPRLRPAGFTLLEMIVVITITGIIAGMIAVFIKAPVDSYFDSVRRAELTDVADTAVRRIARDVHLALPNSVRNPSGGANPDQCVEFMPTKIGGRYRAVPDSAGNGNPLDFTAVDGSFDMLWPNGDLPAASQLAVGDIVVVFNDGTANGNAYTGSNAIRIDGLAAGATAGTTAVSFVDAGTGAPFHRKQLPNESPFYRFQVIPNGEHVVVYACTGGQLIRYRNTIAGAGGRPRPADCDAMRTGAPSVLADNVSACSLHYEPPGAATGINSRNGILIVQLEITQAGESVRLYHQVHVDNTP